jgi:hypothetical protein
VGKKISLSKYVDFRAFFEVALFTTAIIVGVLYYEKTVSSSILIEKLEKQNRSLISSNNENLAKINDFSTTNSGLENRIDELMQENQSFKKQGVQSSARESKIIDPVSCSPAMQKSLDSDLDKILSSWELNRKQIRGKSFIIEDALSSIGYNSQIIKSYITPEVGDPVRRMDIYSYVNSIILELEKANDGIKEIQGFSQ